MAEFTAVVTDMDKDAPGETCGISRDELSKDFIKLQCGHCFNYLRICSMR